MAVSSRTKLAVSAVVAAVTVASLPAHAAPWVKSAEIASEPAAEQVNWRGRRNGAVIAGAVGLGVLGLAAAAAASERRGYYDDGYGYEPGYGYTPSYGYAPQPVYEYEYEQPRRRYVEAPVYGYGPVYRDHGYGYQRHNGGGLTRSQRGRDSIEAGGK